MCWNLDFCLYFTLGQSRAIGRAPVVLHREASEDTAPTKAEAYFQEIQ